MIVVGGAAEREEGAAHERQFVTSQALTPNAPNALTPNARMDPECRMPNAEWTPNADPECRMPE